MKKLEAIIKPFKLDDVIEALTELGIEQVLFRKSADSAVKRAAPRSTRAPNTSSTFFQK